jgi:predicted GNAT family N-acyltransferase
LNEKMRISISIPAQTLALFDDQAQLIRRYSVSTARNGPGEQRGSYCTPRGRHLIRAKVGAGSTANTVFVRRRPTGELWSPALAAQFPERDWMLTRILWLSGTQVGFNRLGEVDTMRRFIYIHGSPDTATMGAPGSIGCVRMHNADIIDLFDRVPAGTRVDIDDFQVTTGPWTTMKSQAAALRTQVFVAEQGVPAELEMDENDAVCWHALATDSTGETIGTGRLLPDGHIGRMAVAAAWRGRGVGRALLDTLLEAANERGMAVQQLNAQTHAAGFYRPFGFVDDGDEFMEAGIPHLAMRRELVLIKGPLNDTRKAN